MSYVKVETTNLISRLKVKFYSLTMISVSRLIVDIWSCYDRWGSDIQFEDSDSKAERMSDV